MSLYEIPDDLPLGCAIVKQRKDLPIGFGEYAWGLGRALGPYYVLDDRQVYMPIYTYGYFKTWAVLEKPQQEYPEWDEEFKPNKYGE